MCFKKKMLKQVSWSTKSWLMLRHAKAKFSLHCGKFEEKILNETKISREHLTPEIALRLITPECRLFKEPLESGNQQTFVNDPFWAFYWPGGQALSRYILDHPETVAKKSILDVGSGCGASSLAALMCKAKYVIANDIDKVASCAILLNAHLNQIPLENLKTCTSNLIGAAVAEDIIFIGDLFYDEDIAEILLPWFIRLLEAGKEIFIGDPGRHGLTAGRLNFMHKLATYELTENCCIENNGFKNVNVWKFS